MAGTRPFDADYWPDQEGFACCFLCGRKVDPRDPQRGTYSARPDACEFIPIHLACINPYYPDRMSLVRDLFYAAINVMGEYAMRRARQEAVVIVPGIR